MLRSMTGQGEARSEGTLGSLVIELRTVNNRHFKLVTRWGEGLAVIESKAESAIRNRVARGTMHLSANWRRSDASNFQLHSATLLAYYQQLKQLQSQLGDATSIDLAHLASLPGVVAAADDRQLDPEVLWETFAPVLEDALKNLDRMRQIEGEAMERKLFEDLQVIQDHLQAIRVLAPKVVEQYRDRLQNRIATALNQLDLKIDKIDVLREVQIYADRSDISEEITRLGSHIEMFRRVVGEDASAGRKLDFVTQEMFREANTIGSKANDAEIAGHVVEIKCAIERMRELVQNLE